MTTSSIRQTHSPRLADAFEAVGGAVVLGGLADDQKRKTGRERRSSGESDGAELGAGEAVGVGLVLANRLRERRAERPQEVGLRLEAVLVEVVLRAAPGAEEEVALEVGRLAQAAGELGSVHAGDRSSCAIGRSRSASGVPSA